MKVAIMTKAVPFGKEEFIGVAKNRKIAEKKLRELFPHMRQSGDSYVSDKENSLLLFVKEEDVLE